MAYARQAARTVLITFRKQFILMEYFQKSARNTVKRSPKRGHYDRETIYQILDAGFICHVSFVINEQPYVIPIAYGRENDTLYLHGAVGNQMLSCLEKGGSICITVTHVDGLVLARSAFHHSVNYRSAVLFGTAHLVNEENKEHALKVISDQILQGRWDEVRAPTVQEIKITKVLAFTIEEASAKIRTGGPIDDEEDYQLPIWAGVLPLYTVVGDAQPDSNMLHQLPLPDSIIRQIQ